MSDPLMTRVELRKFLDQHLCGCGEPESAVEALRKVLAIVEVGQSHVHEALRKRMPDSGYYYLFMYMLDRHVGVIDHGSYVGSSWLTPLGRRVRIALETEAIDNYEALLAPHCSHGVDLTEEHSCDAANAAKGVIVGAMDFVNVVRRKGPTDTMKAAFERTAENSRYESGHSYSGEIGMKRSVKVAPSANDCLSLEAARAEARRLMDEEEDHYCEKHDDHAWAIEVPGEDGGWVFFGLAPS
jgi:hypothetical protein